jgi:hypothetical protein
VLAGPHRSSAATAFDAIFSAQGFGAVTGSADIAAIAGRLIAHPALAKEAGAAAARGAATLRGAVAKSAALLEKLLADARA